MFTHSLKDTGWWWLETGTQVVLVLQAQPSIAHVLPNKWLTSLQPSFLLAEGWLFCTDLMLLFRSPRSWMVWKFWEKAGISSKKFLIFERPPQSHTVCRDDNSIFANKAFETQTYSVCHGCFLWSPASIMIALTTGLQFKTSTISRSFAFAWWWCSAWQLLVRAHSLPFFLDCKFPMVFMGTSFKMSYIWSTSAAFQTMQSVTFIVW